MQNSSTSPLRVGVQGYTYIVTEHSHNHRGSGTLHCPNLRFLWLSHAHAMLWGMVRTHYNWRCWGGAAVRPCSGDEGCACAATCCTAARAPPPQAPRQTPSPPPPCPPSMHQHWERERLMSAPMLTSPSAPAALMQRLAALPAAAAPAVAPHTGGRNGCTAARAGAQQPTPLNDTLRWCRRP
jgi:hypothetical protein